MAGRLKVFTWSDGFHAYTVATTSKPKALAAWGIGQDIFKSGLASEVSSGPAYDAALASPDEVIQTGQAVDMGALEKAPSVRRAGPSQAQKDRVAALERSLEQMDAAHAKAQADMDAELKRLKDQRRSLATAQEKERDSLSSQLKAARGKL